MPILWRSGLSGCIPGTGVKLAFVVASSRMDDHLNYRG